MKLKKYIGGAAVSLLAIGMGSCASDYLDTPQHGIVSNQDICKTTESAYQATIGVSQALSGVWSYDLFFQFLGPGDSAASTFYGEYVGSDAFWSYMYTEAPSWTFFFTMDDSLGYGNYVWDNKMWNYAYAIIGQANEIIEGIDGAEGDENQKNFTKGEILTLRAYAYWRLLQVYGPRWENSNNGENLSVILRLSPSDPQDMPLAKTKDVLAQLYTDLDMAIECYKKAGNYSRTLTYEPDLAVCYGLYARIAALQNDWAKVKEMAHNARQGKRSSTPAQMAKCYTEYDENEWMWSASFLSPIDNNIYSNWGTTYAANAYYTRSEGATTRINRSLYNKIPETDSRRNLWFTIDKIAKDIPAGIPGESTSTGEIDWADFYSNKNVNTNTQDITGRKQRRAATAWIEENTPAGFENAYTMMPDSKDAKRPLICDGAQMKFFTVGNLGDTKMCFPPYMRATEMYLLEAEACAMLGQTAEAQAILNEVNQKYDSAYNCTKTGQDLIDEVRTYTRIELWGEGFCWFNLKRWGVNLERKAWTPNDITSGNIPGGVSCDVAPTDANQWRYGIPLSETNYNNAVSYPYEGNGMIASDDEN